MAEIKVRLGMNDLENALLDSSGEIKVEIGNQIAQQFSKKYLKGVISSNLERDCAGNIRKQINEIIYKDPFWEQHLNSNIEKLIHKCVDNYISKYDINALIDKSVGEHLSNINSAEYIDNLVKESIDRTFKKIIDDHMTKCVNYYYKIFHSKFNAALKELTE